MGSILNSLNPFSKMRGSKTGRVKDSIVIDLSGSLVKIAHIQETVTESTVMNLAVKSLSEDKDEEAAGFIKSSLADFGVTVKQVSCVIPSKYLISRNIDMPSNNQEEIAKIINLQVGRFTPYSRDEIVVDYLCHEVVGQHYTNVLLIIVHRKIVERYYRVLEKINLTVGKIAIASEALSCFYSKLETTSAVKTLGGVHVGESSSDITVMENGKMMFVRNITVGSDQLRDKPESAFTEFCTELNKSITAYLDEGVGKPIEMIVLTGAIANVEDTIQRIHAGCPAAGTLRSGIKVSDYRQIYRFSENANKTLAANPSISFCEPIATHVMLDKLSLDLIPREMKIKREVREGSKDIVTLGILVMTLFLMISMMLSAKIYFKNALLAKLDAMDKSTFAESRTMERVSTKSRTVRKFLENRGRGLFAFEKITGLIGADVFLNEFSFSLDGQIAIGGTADSMSRVFSFVTTLEESGYFSSVKTLETKSRRQGNAEVADFKIACVLAEGFYR